MFVEKREKWLVNIVTKTCLISGDERKTAEPNLYNLSHSLNAAVDMYGYILLVAYVYYSYICNQASSFKAGVN